MTTESPLKNSKKEDLPKDFLPKTMPLINLEKADVSNDNIENWALRPDQLNNIFDFDVVTNLCSLEFAEKNIEAKNPALKLTARLENEKWVIDWQSMSADIDYEGKKISVSIERTENVAVLKFSAQLQLIKSFTDEYTGKKSLDFSALEDNTTDCFDIKLSVLSDTGAVNHLEISTTDLNLPLPLIIAEKLTIKDFLFDCTLVNGQWTINGEMDGNVVSDDNKLPVSVSYQNDLLTIDTQNEQGINIGKLFTADSNKLLTPLGELKKYLPTDIIIYKLHSEYNPVARSVLKFNCNVEAPHITLVPDFAYLKDAAIEFYLDGNGLLNIDNLNGQFKGTLFVNDVELFSLKGFLPFSDLSMGLNLPLGVSSIPVPNIDIMLSFIDFPGLSFPGFDSLGFPAFEKWEIGDLAFDISSDFSSLNLTSLQLSLPEGLNFPSLGFSFSLPQLKFNNSGLNLEGLGSFGTFSLPLGINFAFPDTGSVDFNISLADLKLPGFDFNKLAVDGFEFDLSTISTWLPENDFCLPDISFSDIKIFDFNLDFRFSNGIFNLQKLDIEFAGNEFTLPGLDFTTGFELLRSKLNLDFSSELPKIEAAFKLQAALPDALIQLIDPSFGNFINCSLRFSGGNWDIYIPHFPEIPLAKLPDLFTGLDLLKFFPVNFESLPDLGINDLTVNLKDINLAFNTDFSLIEKTGITINVANWNFSVAELVSGTITLKLETNIGEWFLADGSIGAQFSVGNIPLPYLEGILPVDLSGLDLSMPDGLTFPIPEIPDISAFDGICKLFGLNIPDFKIPGFPDISKWSIHLLSLNLKPDLSGIKGLDLGLSLPEFPSVKGIEWPWNGLRMDINIPDIANPLETVSLFTSLSLGSVTLPVSGIWNLSATPSFKFQMPEADLSLPELNIDYKYPPGLQFHFSDLDFLNINFSSFFPGLDMSCLNLILKSLQLNFDAGFRFTDMNCTIAFSGKVPLLENLVEVEFIDTCIDFTYSDAGFEMIGECLADVIFPQFNNAKFRSRILIPSEGNWEFEPVLDGKAGEIGNLFIPEGTLEALPLGISAVEDVCITEAFMEYNPNSKNVESMRIGFGMQEEAVILPTLLSVKDIDCLLAFSFPFTDNNFNKIFGSASFTLIICGDYEIPISFKFFEDEPWIIETKIGLTAPVSIIKSLIQVSGLGQLLNSLPGQVSELPEIDLNYLRLTLLPKDNSISLHQIEEQLLCVEANINSQETISIIPSILSIGQPSIELGIDYPALPDNRTYYGRLKGTLSIGKESFLCRIEKPQLQEKWIVTTGGNKPMSISSLSNMFGFLGGVSLSGKLPSGFNKIKAVTLNYLQLHLPLKEKWYNLSGLTYAHMRFSIDDWEILPGLASVSKIKGEVIIDAPLSDYREVNGVYRCQVDFPGISIPLKLVTQSSYADWCFMLDAKEPVVIPLLSTIDQFLVSKQLFDALPCDFGALDKCTLTELKLRFSPMLKELKDISCSISTDDTWDIVEGKLALGDIKADLLFDDPFNEEVEISGNISGVFDIFSIKVPFSLKLDDDDKEWVIASGDLEKYPLSAQLKDIGGFINQKEMLEACLPFGFADCTIDINCFEITCLPWEGEVAACFFKADIHNAEIEIPLVWTALPAIADTKLKMTLTSLSFEMFRDKTWEISGNTTLYITGVPYADDSDIPPVEVTFKINNNGITVENKNESGFEFTFAGLTLLNKTFEFKFICHSFVLGYSTGNGVTFSSKINLVLPNEELKQTLGFTIFNDILYFEAGLDSNTKMYLKLLENPFKNSDSPQEDAEWIYADFGDFGAIRFRLPVFKYNGSLFHMKSDVEVLKDIKIPLKSIKEFLNDCNCDILSRFLPDELTADFGLKKHPLSHNIKKEDLPECINQYWDCSLPKAFTFEYADDTARNISFFLQFPENDPLRFVTPDTGRQTGVKLWKIGVGTIYKIYRLELDAVADIFSLETCIALSALKNTCDLFPDMGDVHCTINMRNIFAPFWNSMPIPVLFDEMSIDMHTFADMQANASVSLPAPKINDLTDVIQIGSLISELIPFLTQINYRLDSEKLTTGLLELSIMPFSIKLPGFIGGQTIKPINKTYDLTKKMAHLLNAYKFYDITELVQVIDLDERSFSSGALGNLALGPVTAEVAAVLSTKQEQLALKEGDSRFKKVLNTDSFSDLLLACLSGQWSMGDVFRLDANIGAMISADLLTSGIFVSLSGEISKLFAFTLAGSVTLDYTLSDGNPFKTDADWGLYVIGTRVMHCSARFTGNTVKLDGHLSLFDTPLLKLTGFLEGELTSGGKFSLSGNVTNEKSSTFLPANASATLSNEEIKIAIDLPGKNADTGESNKLELRSVINGQQLELAGSGKFHIGCNIDLPDFSIDFNGRFPVHIPGFSFNLSFSPEIFVQLGNDSAVSISGSFECCGVTINFPAIPRAYITSLNNLEKVITDYLKSHPEEIFAPLLENSFTLLINVFNKLCSIGFTDIEVIFYPAKPNNYSGTSTSFPCFELKANFKINTPLFYISTALEGNIASNGSIYLKGGIDADNKYLDFGSGYIEYINGALKITSLFLGQTLVLNANNCNSYDDINFSGSITVSNFELFGVADVLKSKTLSFLNYNFSASIPVPRIPTCSLSLNFTNVSNGNFDAGITIDFTNIGFSIAKKRFAIDVDYITASGLKDILSFLMKEELAVALLKGVIQEIEKKRDAIINQLRNTTKFVEVLTGWAENVISNFFGSHIELDPIYETVVSEAWKALDSLKNGLEGILNGIKNQLQKELAANEGNDDQYDDDEDDENYGNEDEKNEKEENNTENK